MSRNSLQDPKRLKILEKSGLMDGSRDDSFDRLSRLAARILHVPISAVSFVDDTRNVFKSGVGLNITEIPQKYSLCKMVVLRRECLRITDALKHPASKDNPIVAKFGIRAYLGFPITTKTGEVLGSFCVMDKLPRDWTPEEEQVLYDLCQSVTTEVELKLDILRKNETERDLLQKNIVLENQAAILDMAPAPIIIHKENGEITFWNQGAEKIYGWTRNEAIGSNIHLLLGMNQGIEVDETIKQSLKVKSLWTGELIHRHKNGSSLNMMCKWGVMIGVEGPRIVEINTDITPLREAEKVKDEFISTVSHELRTPLTSMKGALGLLASGKVVELGTQGQKMVDIALQNSNRLIDLINDMRDLERTGGSEYKTIGTFYSLLEVINPAIEKTRIAAQKKDMTYKVNIEDALIEGDSTQLSKVFVHLLSNAVKFSPENSTVFVSSTVDGDTVLIEIRDQGVPIDKGDLKAIFNKFYQIDSSDVRKNGGTGLGLAVAKSIVEKHRGKIWAESTSTGNVFKVELSVEQSIRQRRKNLTPQMLNM